MPENQPSDDELLQRCARADESALAELVHRYGDRIYGLAWRTTGDHAIAADAAANAFVKIWRRASQWNGESAASTWIYSLTYRCALDTLRAQRRWWRRFFAQPKPLAHTPDARQTSPQAFVEGQDEQANLARRVGEAMAMLNESDRALVHLYYFENRSLAEIAAIMKLPAATLKMRLSRARQKLRPILDDSGNEA